MQQTLLKAYQNRDRSEATLEPRQVSWLRSILASTLADAVWEISPKAGRRETSLGLGPDRVLEHEPAESGMDQRSRIQGPDMQEVVSRDGVLDDPIAT